MVSSGGGLGNIRFVLCDLDGVVWLARQAIAGASDAVARLRASGRRVLFVTNNSMALIADQEAALAAIAIPAVDDVVTSSQAAASLVHPGETVLVVGGPGVREAVEACGGRCVPDGARQADVVIVGLHHDFDYAAMSRASTAILDGARFVATNDDASFPTPDGPIPGNGAIVASIATASGVKPTIAGKPYPSMASLVRDRCGSDFSDDAALVVGDRWSTDGRFAATMNCRFALVRSGVTGVGQPVGGAPDVDVSDLAAVADLVIA